MPTENATEAAEQNGDEESPICLSCGQLIKAYEDDGSGLCELCQWVLGSSSGE